MSLYGETQQPQNDLRPQKEGYVCGALLAPGTLGPQQTQQVQCTQQVFLIQPVSGQRVQTQCVTCHTADPVGVLLAGKRPTDGYGRLACAACQGVAFELGDVGNELNTTCANCRRVELLGMSAPQFTK
jgi:hypothetical protein